MDPRMVSMHLGGPGPLRSTPLNSPLNGRRSDGLSADGSEPEWTAHAHQGTAFGMHLAQPQSSELPRTKFAAAWAPQVIAQFKSEVIAELHDGSPRGSPSRRLQSWSQDAISPIAAPAYGAQPVVFASASPATTAFGMRSENGKRPEAFQQLRAGTLPVDVARGTSSQDASPNSGYAAAIGSRAPVNADASPSLSYTAATGSRAPVSGYVAATGYVAAVGSRAPLVGGASSYGPTTGSFQAPVGTDNEPNEVLGSQSNAFGMREAEDRLSGSVSRLSTAQRQGAPSSNAPSLVGTDAIHSALLALEPRFPVVSTFQKINTGFYQVDGRALEISLARNGEKLFAELDSWNRGVRGELVKFLQSLSPAEPAPMGRNTSDKKMSRRVSVGQEGRGNVNRASSPTSKGNRPAAKVDEPPPVRRSPASRKPGLPNTSTTRQSSSQKPGSTAIRSGAVTPRRNSDTGNSVPMAQQRAGTLLVGMRDPLLGEPLVVLDCIEQQAEDTLLLVRLLCNGRVAEVLASHTLPLGNHPRRQADAALSAFEDVFFTGQANDLDEASGQSSFSHVELGELSTRQLSCFLVDCWPPGLLMPLRGLAWPLQPFLVDWLKRRLRPRLFTQLVVTLPSEVLQRPCPGGMEGAPSLQSLFLDLTERDLIIAALLTTPPSQRSRLYALASETNIPLPLAFPALRCPLVPPSGFDIAEDSTQASRNCTVHWDAFESLLARPSERPLLLWLGAQACGRAGKSQILRELTGLETTVPESEGSPAHSPGVDLLPGSRQQHWTADVHGCALGDPTFMALLATLAATSSLIVLHIAPDDFVVEEPSSPPRPAPAAKNRPNDRTSLRKQAGAASALDASISRQAEPIRVSATPELLALLRIFADARLPGIGSSRTRILVLLRDVSPNQSAGQFVIGVRMALETVLGHSFSSLVCIERLLGLVDGRRQSALAGLRAQLQRELSALGESGSARIPCIEALHLAFRQYLDRLTLGGTLPVQARQELEFQSQSDRVLERLLNDAAAQASTNLRASVFPVSEAASEFARLKAQEKTMLEDSDVNTLDDAKIADLSAKLRAVDASRRALLAQPLTPLVHHFVDSVLGEGKMRHAKVVEFGSCLSAWLNPRLVPLLERRRQLLDERLRLSQERRGGGEESKKALQGELAAITRMLTEAEKAVDQFNVSLDLFWGELAAVSDLAAELKNLGVRPPPETPDPQQLKKYYGQWACQLSCPLHLLHGSPLQCAGSFLVDVLKELGAQNNRELFVISCIGIQSSAKSTLLNYLFGCGFATSAGRCTRGLYCSLMECHGKTLLLLDTEGLMSLEADGGDVFDAQLALMAMACSHLVIINHKGELSRQLQDLLEVCLFAMQHLKVCRIQPKLLFVLRDQHERSQHVHTDALRLMRKHLAEASSHLSLRLDELISLDPGSVFLLPSAFASDLDPHTGREVKWSTELFSHEALRLRQKIFREGGGSSLGSRADGDGVAEFSTLHDWCLHTMSVWRVLDRYGPNLLHYKTIQEIEVQRELEELVKRISTATVHGADGLAEQANVLLADFIQRLGESSGQSEQVDTEFRSSLQALLDRAAKRGQAELDRCLHSRKSKLSDASKEEARKKLQMPLEYQGELTRYTWTLSLTESIDRDQLKALKMHFKRTIEELWQAQSSGTQSISESQMRQIFASEWQAFENKCKERFTQTARTQKQMAEEVCLIFNHVLRQHRHQNQTLHVLELIPSTVLLSEAPLSSWTDAKLSKAFLEVRAPGKLAEYAASRSAIRPGLSNARAPVVTQVGSRPADQLEGLVCPELRKHLSAVLSFELADGSAQMPSEETLLDAIHRLNSSVQAEEERFLAQVGVRFQGGRVAFLNATQSCLRHSVLAALVAAEDRRVQHQWNTLQSHRQRTEQEFLGMVQRHTSDAARAKMFAELFFDALVREWLDERLLSVAAEIRSHCLADMPDASCAAERAYQQSFVERNWDQVLEYVLDVNSYLRKIFSDLFEDRKVSILRIQRPQLVAQLGALFDALTGAAHRWGHREAGKQSRLSSFQETLRALAAESRAASNANQAVRDQQSFPLLSERFPVVADFLVEDPTRFAHDLGLHLAALLGNAKVEGIVAEKLEIALQKQEAQVWALIRGCSAVCPCCGSKCDRVDTHTEHRCCHHLLPAFNGWRVAGTCEATLDTCKSCKNHDAPKRSDYSEKLYPNLQEYLKAEHSEWLPFPREDRELLADSVLKAAWVNCRAPLLYRYDMVDSTPAEWISAYEEGHRKLSGNAVEAAEERLMKYGYTIQQ